MNYSITLLEDELDRLEAELKMEIHLFNLTYAGTKAKIEDLKRAISILKKSE